MTMWADNIKFVKDIIDGKYQKIDSAAAEVIFYWYWLLTFIILFLLFCRWMRMQRLCWRIPPARSQGSIFCQPWEFWNWCRLERLKCSWTQSLGYVYLYTQVLVENPNIHCIPCLFVLSVSTCEMWLNFIVFLFQDLHGKEKDLLLSESKEKIATREKALTRAKEVKTQLKI